ncbi:hypothetical protein NG895_21115 [Aeoliella sp. ICT_H6.2]|uniref:Uncharacterized protein n=1 Tax=Aeoliella straminimaris TaxID=2954799 RepID=A0A9X2JI19_9BACT|nr:hypothetical protein [Aeoliella straminimaris]MCO6046406.1 hypothetical protein [Aeoliella straminimaris]
MEITLRQLLGFLSVPIRLYGRGENMGSSTRRGLRLSLRKVLLLVTIVGLVCGLWAQSQQHQTVLAELEERHQRDLAELRAELFRNEAHAYMERSSLFYKWANQIAINRAQFDATEVAGKTIGEWGVGFSFPNSSDPSSGIGILSYEESPILDPECVVLINEPDTPPAVVRAAVVFAVSQVFPWASNLENDADLVVEHYEDPQGQSTRKLLCGDGSFLVDMQPRDSKQMLIQVRTVNRKSLDKLLEGKGFGIPDVNGKNLLQWWTVEEIDQLHGPITRPSE